MIFKKYKYFAVAVALIAIAALCVIGASADDETPIVPIDPPDVVAITLKVQPYKTQYLVGEKLDMTGAELELTYDNGVTGSTPVKTDWCTGFSSSKVGEKTVTVTYPDTSCKATFKVEVVSEKEIKIVPPKTLTYFVGDTEDRSGLSVSVVYSNGKSALLESGYTVSGFSSKTAGEKTITVTYKNMTASYKVNVFEPALTKIAITKKPAKLSYYIGEKLDTTGIKVTATYENGKTADVTSKIKVSGDISSSGVKKITVEYTERDFIKTATFDVTVTDVQIKNIKFATYPSKTVYAENEVFDPTGISITVTYNNGAVDTVTEGLLFTGFDTDTVGEKTVTLHYGGYQLDFNVTVVVSQSHVHKEGDFVRVKEPTCVEEGLERTTCLTCFETVTERAVPALGHGSESMPVQTKAPTCTEAGQTSTYCMVCGQAVTVSDIFPLGHTEGEVQTTLAPTCTEKGESKVFCTVCNAEVKSSVIEALGHSFGEWTVTLEPTGESEGKEERTCSVCIYSENNIINKLSKVLNDGSVSATLNSSTSYYPYNSTFSGKIITGSLSAEELASLIPSDAGGKTYSVIEVFEFSFTDARGAEFLPSCDITYSVEYNLDESEYSSFLIYDTELGRYTPFSDATHFSFTVQRSGIFVLVGEKLPETEPPSSSANDEIPEESGSEITASTDPSGGNSAIITVLIIVAVLLLLVIAALVYTYVFKQYY